MSSEIPFELTTFGQAAAPPVPDELIGAARHAGTALRNRRRSEVRSRLAFAVVALACILAASFTPPGRAATGWISRLAGFGDEPTLQQVGSVRGSAVVVDSGTLSDGTPYEAVIKRIDANSVISRTSRSAEPTIRRRKITRSNIDPVVCLQIDWVDAESVGQGGTCTEGSEAHVPLRQGSAFVYQLPDAPPDVPGLFFGYVDNPAIASVRVVETVPMKKDLPVEVMDIDGSLREDLGSPFPSKVFIVRLDGDLIEAGQDGDAQVEARAFDREGEPLGRVRAFTPPFGCPDGPPASVVEAPPAGSPFPHPASPGEIHNSLSACPPTGEQVEPSEDQLLETPAPTRLLNEAAGLGVQLSPASDEDYPPLHETGSSLASVDDANGAMDVLALPRVQRPARRTDPSAQTGSVITSTRTYLARRTDDGGLVYLTTLVARGFVGPDAPDPESAGLPRQFVGVLDVETGDRLAFGELPPP